MKHQNIVSILLALALLLAASGFGVFDQKAAAKSVSLSNPSTGLASEKQPVDRITGTAPVLSFGEELESINAKLLGSEAGKPNAVAAEAFILDNFNREDGPLTGSWAVRAGDCSISSSAAICGDYGLATYYGAPGDGNTAEMDIETRGTAEQYAALVLNFGGDGKNIFIKVQQQEGSGQFEYLGCYMGNNLTPFGQGFRALNSIFGSAHMKATHIGSTIAIEFTNVDNGEQPDQRYTCTDAPGFTGKGIGIAGFNNKSLMDNFTLPEDYNVVIWDQPASTTLTEGLRSQKIGDNPSNSLYLADDFTVEQPWVLDTITIFGQVSESLGGLQNADRLVWKIFKDNGSGLPAGQPESISVPPYWSLDLDPSDSAITLLADANGKLATSLLTLPSPLDLPVGDYWLVFYVVAEQAETFGILPADSENGEVAKLINPSGALAYGTGWVDVTVVNPQVYDLAFRLTGLTKTRWTQIATSLAARYDNVLAAYGGQIWNITGFGNEARVTRMDSLTGLWSIVPNSSPEFGKNHVRSGCQSGNKMFVYGDGFTQGFEGLWSYDMSQNLWTSETPSGNAPDVTGIWAPAWVLDYETGLCYLTGGTGGPQGEALNSVYVYNSTLDYWEATLPGFTTARDFHAAFIYQPSGAGNRMLCVAGGMDNSDKLLGSTQCYDLVAKTWHAENVDLKPLPVPLAGMGYTQAPDPDTKATALWLVGGVTEGGQISEKTWYTFIQSGKWIDGGALQTGPTFRTGLVTLNNRVYHVGGAVNASLLASGLADRYLPAEIYLPLTLQQ